MSQMIEVKTADLIGDLLDCLVAVVENPEEKIFFNADGYTLRWHNKPPAYSTDWAHGGPLIERYKIGLLQPNVSPCGEWHASVWHPDFTDYTHKTSPLIAACRAIVAAKLGDVVSVPAELVGV